MIIKKKKRILCVSAATVFATHIKTLPSTIIGTLNTEAQDWDCVLCVIMEREIHFEGFILYIRKI